MPRLYAQAAAAKPNVATRIDAIGTIYGRWTTEQVRPWLLAIVDLFGADLSRSTHRTTATC